MVKRPSDLPVIIVSGASGFVGRYFLDAIKDKYYIYGLARRSQKEAGIAIHPNIVWNRLDIADEIKVKHLLEEIAERGGADYFLHLAAFYNFQNSEDREYERTNILGTENILKYCKDLGLSRFIFSSTLTVSEFTKSDSILTEKSPADATFPYARSKSAGEALVKKYSKTFPCVVVRQSAIFSDWCEYLPLYSFLSTWLSPHWNCRLLAGKGRAAVPYLHIYDLVFFFLQCLKNSKKIPDFKILIASSPKCTSHKELFEIATKYKYFENVEPMFIPKSITRIGIFIKCILGRLINTPTFEKIWMVKYIDREMRVNPASSYAILSWTPTSRYDIKRRLLFLIANMKSNPFEWRYRNEIRPYKAVSERKYLIIYESLIAYRQKIIQSILEKLLANKNRNIFPSYQKINLDKLIFRVGYLYKMLENDLKTGDRTNLLEYARKLAEERYIEGFIKEELMEAVRCTGESIVEILSSLPELNDVKQKIYDEIMVSIQMVIDKIEDTYDSLIKFQFDKRSLKDKDNAFNNDITLLHQHEII